MKEDFLKILGIIALVIFLLYLASSALKLHMNVQNSIFEGLANNGENGVGGSAATYATSIAQQCAVLQDSLLIKKYKTDYENVVIHLEEQLGYLMLQTALQFSTTGGMSPENLAVLTNLNTLDNAKRSLNSVMTVIDAQ